MSKPRIPKKVDKLIQQYTALSGWAPVYRLEQLEAELREAIRDALDKAEKRGSRR